MLPEITGSVVELGKCVLRGGWHLDNGQWVEGWVPAGSWQVIGTESNTIAHLLPAAGNEVAPDWKWYASQKRVRELLAA